MTLVCALSTNPIQDIILFRAQDRADDFCEGWSLCDRADVRVKTIPLFKPSFIVDKTLTKLISDQSINVLMFTSVNAVHAFAENDISQADLAHVHTIFCVGDQTTDAAQDIEIFSNIEIRNAKGDASQLFDMMLAECSIDDHILFCHGDVISDQTQKLIEQSHLKMSTFQNYEMVLCANADELLSLLNDTENSHLYCFFSKRAMDYIHSLQERIIHESNRTCICLSERIAKGAHSDIWSHVLVSDTPTRDGMRVAIEKACVRLD